MTGTVANEGVTTGPSSRQVSQLALLEVAAPTWRLDRRTREIGRRGVASAREALRRAGTADDENQRSDWAA
jgi:hypothetical protein